MSPSCNNLSTLKLKQPEILSCTTSMDAKYKIMVSPLEGYFASLMHSSLETRPYLAPRGGVIISFLARFLHQRECVRPSLVLAGAIFKFQFNNRHQPARIAAACYTPRALFVETINHYKCGARLLLAVRSFHSFLSRLDNTMRHVYCHCLWDVFFFASIMFNAPPMGSNNKINY